MAMQKRDTVIGVFETRDQGHRAVEALRGAGFPDGDITMVMHHDIKGDVDVSDLDAAKAAQVTGESKAPEGAVLGALAGGVGGAGLAVAMGLIPGIGPVLSLGFLTPTLLGIGTGAAIGAAGGGIVGALIGLDIPEDEARFYERELKAGRVLVGVKAGNRYDEAWSVLEHCGAHHPLAAAAV